MAKVAFHLPGGRGILKSADALALEGEQRRVRAKELPEDGPLYLSNMTTISPEVTASALINGEAFLTLLQPLYHKIVVTSVAIVPIATLGDTLQIALYRLQRPEENCARMIAGTKITITPTVTGRVVTKLAKPVELLPSYRLMMGWCMTGTAGTTFWSTNISSVTYTAGIFFRLNALVTTSLPEKFMLENKSGNGHPIPEIYYLTEQANMLV